MSLGSSADYIRSVINNPEKEYDPLDLKEAAGDLLDRYEALLTKAQTFEIRTENEGTCEVELVRGCGSSPQGVSVRFNGICVAHFTESGSELAPSGWLSMLDVYPTNGRVAGLNWVDIYQGNRGAPTEWIEFLRDIDLDPSERPKLRCIANYLENLNDHQ